MKKVLVLYTYITYNYGSMMMCENLLKYLNMEYKGKIDFYLDVKNEEELIRIKKATEMNNVYRDKIMDFGEIKNIYLYKLKELFLMNSRYKKSSHEYDMIIYLGGDVFSEIPMNRLEKLYNIFKISAMKNLLRESKVILLGQTIGPYTGIRKKLVNKIFPKFTIFTRDDINLETMKKDYGVEAKSSRDLAFLNLNLQESYEKKYSQILKKYKLEDNQYIVIVGTEFSHIYSNNEKNFQQSFINIIKSLKTKYQDKKVVWLTHVNADPPYGSDNRMLDALNQNFENYINQNLVVIRKKMLPVEARIILGHSKFTVTCRMHAAVSTYQMGKLAIALSYSPKYKGVIADGLGMKELVIEAKDDLLWEGKIVDEVMKRTDLIDKKDKELIKKSQKKVTECQRKVTKTIKDLSKLLEEEL